MNNAIVYKTNNTKYINWDLGRYMLYTLAIKLVEYTNIYLVINKREKVLAFQQTLKYKIILITNQ